MEVSIGRRIYSFFYPLGKFFPDNLIVRESYVCLLMDWSILPKDLQKAIQQKINRLEGDRYVEEADQCWCGLMLKRVNHHLDFNFTYLAFSEFDIESVAMDFYTELIKNNDLSSYLLPVKLNENEINNLSEQIFFRETKQKTTIFDIFF